MTAIGNISRLLLLWFAAVEHHVGSSPPVSNTNDDSSRLPTGDTDLTNGGRGEGMEGCDDLQSSKGARTPTGDLIHDPWFVVGLSRGMGFFSKTFVGSVVLLETFCRLKPNSLFLSLPMLSSAPSPSILLCAVSVLLGARIRLSCYATLGRFYTFTHTTRSGHMLIRDGPYGHIRHPAYVGSALMRLGMVGVLSCSGGWVKSVIGHLPTVAEAWSSLWDHEQSGLLTRVVRVGMFAFVGWSVAEVAALLVRARREDATLRARFGREWDDYRKDVPYMFVPYVI